MSGVISLLSVKKGERVAGNSFNVGTEMMRVADMSVMEVRVDVGENDVPKVHLGDSALIEVDAYSNRKFKGIVTQIASSSKGASQVSAVTNDVTNYEVRIRLLPSSYNDLIDPKKPKSFPFRPGMNASADIQTKRHENVLTVPINAVTTRENVGLLVLVEHPATPPSASLITFVLPATTPNWSYAPPRCRRARPP